jgi:hypothetical protein
VDEVDVVGGWLSRLVGYYAGSVCRSGVCRWPSVVVVPCPNIRLLKAHFPKTLRTHPLAPDNNFVFPLMIWTRGSKTQLLGCFADT